MDVIKSAEISGLLRQLQSDSVEVVSVQFNCEPAHIRGVRRVCVRGSDRSACPRLAFVCTEMRTRSAYPL
eukprot:scaffold386180_cov31-Attheya_sp.AAC.1